MIPTNRVPLYYYTKKARKVKKNLPGRELVSWGDTKFMVCGVLVVLLFLFRIQQVHWLAKKSLHPY